MKWKKREKEKRDGILGNQQKLEFTSVSSSVIFFVWHLLITFGWMRSELVIQASSHSVASRSYKTNAYFEKSSP